MFNQLIPESKTTRILGDFSLLALLFWVTSDIAITTATPGAEFRRMLSGLLHPRMAAL